MGQDIFQTHSINDGKIRSSNGWDTWNPLKIVAVLRGVAIFGDLLGIERDLYFQVRGLVLVPKVKRRAKHTVAA